MRDMVKKREYNKQYKKLHREKVAANKRRRYHKMREEMRLKALIREKREYVC